MKFLLQKLGLLALVGCLMFYSLPSEAAVHTVSCPGQSLQAKLDDPIVLPGDTIQVSGTCTENVLVRNGKQQLTIQGTGVTPTINGPAGSLATINVRGKGILIQGLVITGGKSGIHVNRASNAVINGNTINSSDYGIRVDQQSFAVITNNTISGNVHGIFVDENSTVRVGYNLDTDTSASPNTISGNTNGIVVQGNSNAKIAGNTIIENSTDGIVIQQSHAVLGANNIGNNDAHGIQVILNSSLDLAVSNAGPSFLSTVNNSNGGNNGGFGGGGNNGGFGLVCSNGGYVRGSIGTLSGESGVKNVVAPCQDLL